MGLGTASLDGISIAHPCAKGNSLHSVEFVVQFFVVVIDPHVVVLALERTVDHFEHVGIITIDAFDEEEFEDGIMEVNSVDDGCDRVAFDVVLGDQFELCHSTSST